VRSIALAWLLSATLLPTATPVMAQAGSEACGSLKNGYGPYDYRTDQKLLAIVDQFHFTPQVENLIKPMGQHFGGDFDYTLRASPNHHRALITLARFSRQVNDPQPPATRYSVDCYFVRAMRFAPDDMIVRMIYADHLTKLGRTSEAAQHLDYATFNAGDNAFTHYNIGLLYFELKLYDKALQRAHEAMRLGFPLTDLKGKLAAAGKWVDPPDTTAAAPAASAAGAN